MVRTGVDRLIAFLEGKDKVLLSEAASALAMPSESIQLWVDFLVEENIVGIEYKFTKPYIYLNRTTSAKTRVIKEGEYTWDTYHRAFLQRAHEKGVSDIEAATLWKNHVVETLEQKKRFFFDEARKRDLHPDALWENYRIQVLLRV